MKTSLTALTNYIPLTTVVFPAFEKSLKNEKRPFFKYEYTVEAIFDLLKSYRYSKHNYWINYLKKIKESLLF